MKKLVQGFSAVVAAGLLFMAPAQSQTTDGWYGEGSFSAGNTTGNTDTIDIGLGLDLGKKQGVWEYGVQALADFGETDSIETRNRWFVGGTVDRYINDRLFAFGNTSYEQDEFSGFENRFFIGGGLGYQVFETPKQSWDVRGGPGFKLDNVRDTTCAAGDADGLSAACAGVADPTTAIFEEGGNETSVAGVFASNYVYNFNDAVTFTNDTDVLAAQVSTQIVNVAAVTAKLSDKLSGRVSYEVRHETSPPAGFEATDTATKIAIVYGFGK